MPNGPLAWLIFSGVICALIVSIAVHIRDVRLERRQRGFEVRGVSRAERE